MLPVSQRLMERRTRGALDILTVCEITIVETRSGNVGECLRG